jgi:hypothetical protein
MAIRCDSDKFLQLSVLFQESSLFIAWTL